MDRRVTGRGRLPRLHTFDSWIRYRDYRFLWVGNFCANSAQWLQLLTAGWLVLRLTEGTSSSPLQVITVGGLSTLPILVVGPWAGVLGDRVDRRKLVMATTGLMVVAAVIFALLEGSGAVQESWHVYVYVLVVGALRTITMPMQQALIANTVPRQDIMNAYAVNVLTIPGTRVIGPLIGGILIATLGFFWNFIIEAALYACVILVLLPMKTPHKETATAGESSPLANLKEGIQYIWRGERVIFNLIILALIPNVLLHPLWFLLPIFTADVFDRGADWGGYLLSTTGFGGLVAALVIASVGFIFKKGMICLAAVVVSSICVILFARSEWLPISMAVIGVMAFSQAAFRTTNGTLIQLLSPDALRGRITSLHIYDHGFVIFSSILIGVFAIQTSPAFAVTIVGGLGLALSALFFLTYRRVRRLE